MVRREGESSERGAEVSGDTQSFPLDYGYRKLEKILNGNRLCVWMCRNGEEGCIFRTAVEFIRVGGVIEEEGDSNKSRLVEI